MSEPRFNVTMRNGAEGICQRVQQGLEGARFRSPQGRLDLRPAQFNRIEVGRVGRQEFQACPFGFDELADMRCLVRRQIINQDNISAAQGRDQHLCDVHLKSGTIHAPFQNPGRLNALPAQGSNQGIVRARITGGGFDHALPRCRAPKQTGQAQIHPAFIDEFQALNQRTEVLGNPLFEFPAQALDPRRFALAIME
jgi:hypothetical protein